MLAEPFDAFTFSPAGASVYQLGNFGTARKELKAWELNMKPIASERWSRRCDCQSARLARITLAAVAFSLLVRGAVSGTARPAALMERRPRKAGNRRLREGDDRQASPNFVPPEERIATFDQDGTLWVEHPIYCQVVYCLDRVPAAGQGKAGAREGRAVQDRALRRPRGDREAVDARTSRKFLLPRSPA